MEIDLGEHHYGVSGIEFLLIDRSERHRVRQFRADVRFAGGIDEVYRDGDNTRLLPTSAIENTTHVLSLDHANADPEEFALALARRFLVAAEHVDAVDVRLESVDYVPIVVEGRADPHNFTNSERARQTASVELARGGSPQICGGISGLQMFMTTGSTFTEFSRDEYTTTPVFEDRAFGAEVTATWTFASDQVDYQATRQAAHAAMLAEFAQHTSRSSQHTFFSLGRAVLSACPDVSSVVVSGTHQRRNLVDLSGLGVSHDRELYQVLTSIASVVSARADRGDEVADR